MKSLTLDQIMAMTIPDIDDAELLAKEAAEAKKYEEEKRIKRLEKMNIAPIYYDCDIKDFQVVEAWQKHALESATRLLSGNIKKLILVGSNGTGKTFLASMIVKKMGGLILSIFEMGLRIRESYQTNSEAQLLEYLSSVPCLVVDELEKVKNTESVKANFNYIMDKRHSRNLSTILISNFHLKKHCPKGGCDHCFETILDPAVVSRFKQDSEIVEMIGSDWRSKNYTKV